MVVSGQLNAPAALRQEKNTLPNEWEAGRVSESVWMLQERIK